MTAPTKNAARQQIFSSLRRALRREQPGAETRAELEARLRKPQANLIPARGQLPPGEQLDLMEAMLQELSATVVRLGDAAEVPKAVADYLKNENLPPEIRLAPRECRRSRPVSGSAWPATWRHSRWSSGDRPRGFGPDRPLSDRPFSNWGDLDLPAMIRPPAA